MNESQKIELCRAVGIPLMAHWNSDATWAPPLDRQWVEAAMDRLWQFSFVIWPAEEDGGQYRVDMRPVRPGVEFKGLGEDLVEAFVASVFKAQEAGELEGIREKPKRRRAARCPAGVGELVS